MYIYECTCMDVNVLPHKAHTGMYIKARGPYRK